MISRRIPCFLLLGVFSFYLCACGVAEIAQGKEIATRTSDFQPSYSEPLYVVRQATATSTAAFQPAAPTLAVKFTPEPVMEATLVPSATPEAQPTKIQVSVCSPLKDFPLEKLPKIVSVPYQPPPMGSDDRHQGVDFVYHRLAGVDIPIVGVLVDSVLPGIVAASLSDTFPYGNVVMVETPGSWLPESWLSALGMQTDQSLYHLYAHLQEKPMVELGQELVGCQALGKVGHSGNTDAAHLHLEMRIGPAGSVFPSLYGLLANAPEEGRKNYKLWRTSGIYQHFDPMLLLEGLD
jgi:murein DD-endopeptidase MepM/ murein hydrolase activator NlpD